MAFPERRQHLFRMRQRLDRMRQHFAAGIEDLPDDLCGHAPICDVDRRLDHRQGEAFHAETVMRDVAPLGRQEVFVEMARLGMVAQELKEFRLRHLVEALVMPERVVGIEPDGRQLRHWSARRGRVWSVDRSRI